jgi:hypothetical protein
MVLEDGARMGTFFSFLSLTSWPILTKLMQMDASPTLEF